MGVLSRGTNYNKLLVAILSLLSARMFTEKKNNNNNNNNKNEY